MVEKEQSDFNIINFSIIAILKNMFRLKSIIAGTGLSVNLLELQQN